MINIKKERSKMKMSKMELVILLMVCLTIFNILYQTMVSENLYYQNRILTSELVKIRGEIRELKAEQEPIAEFLREVNEIQKRIEGSIP